MANTTCCRRPSCSYNATELLDKLNNLEKRLTRLQYIQAEVKTQSKKMKEIKDRVTATDFRGDKGYKGVSGAHGHKGVQGAPGRPGDCEEVTNDPTKGPIGPPGHKGVKGDPGTKGPCNCRGERGERGLPGESVKGMAGPPGFRGAKGERGPSSSFDFASKALLRKAEEEEGA